MSVWRFIDQQDLGGLVEAVPSYNHTLGWMAGLLAVFAGFTLFPTLARMRLSRTPVSRRAWHLGGAVTMGIGFWGSQNMALLGFDLPASYTYVMATGFAALVPVIAGCAAAMRVLANQSPSLTRLHLGALSLALGIAGMHYTLMEAIRGDVILAYDPGLAAISLLLGYGFAWVALYVNRMADGAGRYGWVRWLLGSLVLGVTVLGNHYSAMAGAHFFDDPAIASTGVAAVPAVMIPAIGGCVMFLVTAFWIGSLVDGRIAEAGEAVRSSEARHRAVVETMLDAHVITDRQGRVRSFNPAAEEAFGWKAADILGQPVTLLMRETRTVKSPNWAARSDQAAAMAPAKRRWVYPEGGLRKDGSAFPLELAISPFTVDGQQYFSCTVRDLSDRWAAEARLRRLGAAIEQAGDAIALVGADHRVQYVNPQYERQTGYTREEVIGRPPLRGAPDEGVHDEIWATAGRGHVWTGQVRTRRRDSTVCVEELSVTPVIDGHGTITGYVAVARDIGRRLEADLERRRLAEALKHCTDSIEILDSQGRIVYVNAAFETGTGQRLADIRGSRPEALTDFGADAESYEDMMRTAYRGGRPWSGTLKSIGPSGSLREEEVTVSPMRDDRGQASGYVVVKRDATDRRRLEAEARQRQTLESIGQLADGLARELSAPLQNLGENLAFLRESFRGLDVLIGEIGVLAERPAPVPPAVIAGTLQSADTDFLRREIARAAGESADATRRVTGIVQAMRELSHSDAQRTAIDLNRAIRSVITVTAGEWQPVAEVRTDLDAGLPPVQCLPGDISLLLLRLLGQAAQAVAAANRTGIRGKGVIAISTRRLDDAAEIRIGNTGVEPRHPDDSLAVARDIVVGKHGGTVALESEPGKGATFVIRLPIEPAASAAASAAA